MHTGFILLAVSSTTPYSKSTIIFYLLSYIFMNIGIWYASIIYNTQLQSDDINDYKGLFKKHPYFSSAFIINLISLAGLPPTSGFIAKLYLFSSIASNASIWLIILFFTMFATVIGMFMYLKIIKQLFITSQSEITINNQNHLQKIILYICTFITLILCLFPSFFIEISQIISF